ncbi:MAG: 1-deoxy-D-xylulose-5-phosphate reductoisomerase [Bacteroidetes bacterium GWF2_33_16]|nr:MAG: 1-deoxy-D-xylulose-5-phosphate reductoisomerase [Bacteroidetes bacterium GWE2_32_14]OFY03955.1 MAG: 1-deoxy-D-xylulose-5-phosphate reductoisomerase [Bacteroidetes bacterium GWF2_33_16]
MKKRVAILGSTGSIGKQTLDVIREFPDKFEVEVLTANNNIDLLIQQAREFVPNTLVIANESKYSQLTDALSDLPIKVYTGADAISQVVEMDTIDIVLTAMVGFSGLLPTINAIKAKKTIALANKETLVVAGELIRNLALENKTNIFPVDSEHSAIFQCLVGENHNAIEKVYLTASGGPFRGKNLDFLKNVTPAMALKHPNWDMGAKITIDSATLMNKGFEAIEARWLFDLKPEQIDIIVHPQSIVHSIVQFEDGSMKAQMGLPDMKLPILYALSFPFRYKAGFQRFNFIDYPQLSFEKPDLENFKNLSLAFLAMEKGGNIPCILNAANEIAVNAFLNEKIGFLDMTDVIVKAMDNVSYIKNPSLDQLINTDIETRRYSETLIVKIIK